MYTPNVVKKFDLKNATYRKIMMRTGYANYSNVYEREREKREILIIRRLELVYGRLISFFYKKDISRAQRSLCLSIYLLKRMRV